MISCPICGSTNHDVNEWRHCPNLDNQLICGTNHCKVCNYFRKPEDAGTLWCTYYHGRAEKQKVNIPGLEQQIKDKKILIEKHYSENKPKLAERAIWEMVRLQTKLRETQHEIHIT